MSATQSPIPVHQNLEISSLSIHTTRKLLMDNSPPSTAPPTACMYDVEGACLAEGIYEVYILSMVS